MKIKILLTSGFIISSFLSSHALKAQISCPPEPAIQIITPDAIVGNGTASSCTETVLRNALVNGGNVKCNCGPNPVTINVANEIVISKTTVLDGGGLVSISGNNKTRIFSKNPAAEFTLQNISLINGKAQQKGGAVFCNTNGFFPAEKLKCINVNFRNNTTIDTVGKDIGGGAIYPFMLKELIISGCTFDYNKGSNGGAIAGIGSDIKIINSTFSNNVATGQHALEKAPYGGEGGALFIDNVHLAGINRVLSICGSKFINNKADKRGGAIFTVLHDDKKCKFLVDQSLFKNNVLTNAEGTNGGAIYYQEDHVAATPDYSEENAEIKNSTFTGNAVTTQGGAIWTLIYGKGKITNCTFEGNKGTKAGSALGGALVVNKGIYDITNVTIANNYSAHFSAAIFSGNEDVSTRVTLKNSIISNNTYGFEWIGQCNKSFVDGGGNIQWPRKRPNGSDDGLCAAGIRFVDPLLSPLAENGGPTPTMALQAGSPAINTGAGCSLLDQRGFPREGICDVGAFEYGASSNSNNPPTVSVTSPTNNAIFNAGANITVNVNAFDTDGSISKVEFYNGTTKLGEDLTSPYSFTWNKVNAGSYILSAKAFDNLGASATSSNINIKVNEVVVPGDGLSAVYYDNIDFTGLTFSRIDTNVNFNWGYGSPSSSIGTNTFSARWAGKIKPQYSQNYTFFTTSDDGVRLWVNGVLVINNWTNHAPTENSGVIALTAGQLYDIKLEYFENSGGAVIKLSWASESQPKQVIPKSFLFSGINSNGKLEEDNFIEEGSQGDVFVSPIPAQSSVKVSLMANEDESQVSIQIKDLWNKEVLKKEESLVQGGNTLFLDLEGVSSGNYILIIETNKRSYKRKLMVIK